MFWLSLMLLSCELCLFVLQRRSVSLLLGIASYHQQSDWSNTLFTAQSGSPSSEDWIHYHFSSVLTVCWLLPGGGAGYDWQWSRPVAPACTPHQTDQARPGQDQLHRENVTEGLRRRFSPRRSPETFLHVIRSEAWLFIRMMGQVSLSSTIISISTIELSSFQFERLETSHKPMHDWLILRLVPFSSKLTDRLYQG